MSPLFTYKDKLLQVDDKLAGDKNCCCNKCSIIEIVYDWTFSESKDLDTKTTFNSVNVGYNCNGGDQYISWGGDNTSPNGTETVIVNVKKALEDNIWQNQVDISLNAFWWTPVGGQGPTKFTVTLKEDNGKICKSVCCITGDLPQKMNCADNLVGTVTVKENNGQITTFDLNCNECTGQEEYTTPPPP